ncbi:MAG: metalloregulator ArsR/SmtB family transcription factor [Acidimicrobiales bacterium]
MAAKAAAKALVIDEECCPAVLATALSEERAVELARDFAVLADPVRLRLLSLLASAPTGEACVCELVEPLARSQPTVSHHLKVLADAGLIVGEKRGRWVWYRAVPSRLGRLSGVLA